MSNRRWKECALIMWVCYSGRRPVVRGSVFVFLVLMTVVDKPQLHAQTNGWNTRWRGKIGMERDDNIFHLSTSQMLKMGTADTLFRQSGRYNDMKSIEDVIIPVSLEFEASIGNGISSLPLSLQAEVEYQPYTRNPKRSHFVLGVTAQQKVSERGRIRLRSEYIPSLFWKNYLADATDLTGKVNEGERIYRPATYREWDVSLDYKHHFEGMLHWLSGMAVVGYRARTYDDPFPGRNQRGLRGTAELEFDFTKRWSAEVGFVYESVKSPVAEEIMILDEPDYMMDFNNDLDVADHNRRTVQRVDRSRSDGLIHVATTIKPLKKLTLQAQFEHLRRHYNSQEPIDPANRGRVDNRNSFELGVDYNLVWGLHIQAKYSLEKQMTNTPGDPESLGETLDYEVRTLAVGLKWRF
ncbi:MAG: hypothetical protein AAB393_06525 [Bacteroidota bacterium]